jgi:hypothetical protein
VLAPSAISESKPLQQDVYTALDLLLIVLTPGQLEKYIDFDKQNFGKMMITIIATILAVGNWVNTGGRI